MARSIGRISPDSALALMWAAATVLMAVNLFVWLRYFQPAPWWDMVDLEWFLSQWSFSRDGLGPVLSFADNEHRSFLPHLLRILDRDLFASTGLFLILVNLACFIAAGVAFARHAALALTARPRLAQVATAGMLMVMLWSAQWNNIIRTKQTHFCMALASMALAFWLMARIDARRTQGKGEPWAEIAGAGLLLINAAWTFAGGLATLPAALIFVLVRPWSWAARGGIIASCLFAAATYAWATSGAPSSGGEEHAAASLATMGLFALNFLGGASRAALGGDEVLAPILGGAALALSLPLLWFGFAEGSRRRAELTRPQRQAAAFFALVILWSLVCAVGITPFRAHLGVDQAMAIRYVMFTAPFLAAVAMSAVIFRRLLASWVRKAAIGIAAFYLFAIVVTFPRGWLMAADHHRMVALGAVAATLAIDDPDYTLYAGFAEGRLLELVEDYRANGASFFRRDWGGWLGRPADDTFTPAPAEACARVEGAAVLTPLGDGAYRVAARAPDADGLWLVVIDGDGRVAGLARRGERFRYPPVPALEHGTHAGFARLDDTGRARILAVRRDRSMCPLVISETS